MDQYDGNNEMEVLDNGICEPKYPLANAPASEWENMNYRDVMNMSIGRTYIEQQDVIGAAISTSIQVIGQLLKLAHPALGVAAGIINSIFKFLWPILNNQSEWDQFMQAVEIMIDQKIDNYARNKALAELQGLQEVLLEYQDTLADLATDPTNPGLQSIVLNQAQTTDNLFRYAMPSFRVQGFEPQLLVVYAQAANLHLSLLRDMVKFGSQWGMPSLTIEGKYQDLKKYIQEYTDHCVITYNQGLQKAKSLIGTLNPKDYNKYPYLNPYSNGGNAHYYGQVLDWNVMNDFRRDMTLMVLDLVVIWPTYDPRQYTNPNGVEIELSREVYSTAYGKVGESWENWEVIENAYVRPPQLVSWLTNVAIYLKKYPANTTNTLKLDQYDGVINTLKTTNSTSTWETGFSPLSKPEYRETRNVPGDYINGINMSLGMVPCSLNLTTASSGNFDVGICRYGLAQSNIYYPPVTIPSHRLSYVNAIDNNFSGYYGQWGLGTWGFGWLHNSLKTTNIIHATRSSHIPAVKARILTNGATVIKGPGSTGGALVQLPAVSGDVQVRMNMTREVWKNYQVRIRYAASSNAQLFVGKWTGSWAATTTLNLAATYSGALTYNAFKYADVPFYITTGEPEFSFELRNDSGGPIIIDRIEFIPIEGNLEEYEAKRNLEKARKAVNALFTNGTENALRIDVTDYDVDQVANLVGCMSNDIYPKEKMCLLDQVKLAKRLSQARNLLKYGDFESPDWSGTDGWRISNLVTVQADNPIFKGRYLNMPGANVLAVSDTVFPTYVYQKIDESTLKPYTRYIVRGLVGNSKDLEVLITRYDKEVYKKINVPNDIIPINPCNGTYQLEQSSYPMIPNNTISQGIECDPCGNKYRNEIENIAPPSNILCQNPHEFECHIDIGEINTNRNLGIWIILKIVTSDGIATLGNLEVIEANPLTGEALARMKKREHKWKQKWTEQQREIEKAVQEAQSMVQSLFTCPNQNQLKSTITMNDILHAESSVQKIPYVYHPFLQSVYPTVPGETYDIFQQLSFGITRAKALYNQRNMIRNGDFTTGLSDWNMAGNVDIQQVGNESILQISDWSANLAQDVYVNPEHGYLLRVTARKEGSGEGYVTISDCTEDNTEVLKFTVGEEMKNLSHADNDSKMQERYHTSNLTNYSSENYRADAYPSNSSMMNYQSKSFGITPHSNTNTIRNDYSKNYDMNASSNNINITNSHGRGCGCGCSTNESSVSNNITTYSSTVSTIEQNGSSGYVTKTVGIFPETNRIRIEIGETAGRFMVESVELIQMDC
ncbi:TPA: hypothetical protein ROY01_005730 [Bacillus toyonensis]|nr:hypothetical protein [Bacillus toyonensis]